MRIVFATHAYAPAIGGAERYARGLAEAMAAAGHDVHILTPNRTSAEAFYEYGHPEAGEPTIHLNGVTVHRIAMDTPRSWWPVGSRSVGPIKQAKAAAMWRQYAEALGREIGRVAPDATVALPHAFPNVPAALDAVSRGVGLYAPLLHEEDPAWRAEPIANQVANSDILIALTNWERDRLVESYAANPEQTFVAPPAVDAPDADTVTGHPSPTPYVISIGRRVKSKQLPVIARSVAALRSDGVGIRHVIVGPAGDADVDLSLEEFGDTVEIVGEVDEATKWSLLKGSIASVSLSDHESFGIATLESWRMRRPVITRRTPVTSELVEDGTTGLLVDDGATLEQALRQILDSPPATDAMGSAGFARATEFSWKASAKVLLAAIQSHLP